MVAKPIGICATSERTLPTKFESNADEHTYRLGWFGSEGEDFTAYLHSSVKNPMRALLDGYGVTK